MINSWKTNHHGKNNECYIYKHSLFKKGILKPKHVSAQVVFEMSCRWSWTDARDAVASHSAHIYSLSITFLCVLTSLFLTAYLSSHCLGNWSSVSLCSCHHTSQRTVRPFSFSLVCFYLLFFPLDSNDLND